MAEDNQRSSMGKSSPDSHIPPPTDPYVTYQTPYPRKSSDEKQNPFIEFRRLADAAFSAVFAGLPKVLGTEKFKEANIRESDQAFVKAFDKQAAEFENRIAEMVRARVEEAEGFSKKMEQEWEERRRENEKRMEEESQRWDMMRRGLEKCPGLRPEGANSERAVESELDLYDGLRAYDASAYKPKPATDIKPADRCPWKDDGVDKKCPWNENDKKPSWLSSLGFDGRRRAKNIPLYAPRSSKKELVQESNVHWQQYDDEEMDPFTEDDHVVPWLRLSPYSPLSLLQDLNPVRMMYEDCYLPWDEAFEELMSIHKTGELSNSASGFLFVGGPNRWMTEMASQGTLGPKWNAGFMASALIESVDGECWRGFDGFRGICRQLAGRAFRETISRGPDGEQYNDEDDIVDENDNDEKDQDDDSNNWVRLAEDSLESRLQNAYDEAQELAQALFGDGRSPDTTFGARGMRWPTPEEVMNALLENVTDPEDQLVDNRVETMNTTPSRDAHASSIKSDSLQKNPDQTKVESIVSTMTTTTSRTLPDGSTETKMVLKKRFADGTEENTESTEVLPAPPSATNNASTQTVSEQTTDKYTEKGGWFWN